MKQSPVGRSLGTCEGRLRTTGSRGESNNETQSREIQYSRHECNNKTETHDSVKGPMTHGHTKSKQRRTSTVPASDRVSCFQLPYSLFGPSGIGSGDNSFLNERLSTCCDYGGASPLRWCLLRVHAVTISCESSNGD